MKGVNIELDNEKVVKVEVVKVEVVNKEAVNKKGGFLLPLFKVSRQKYLIQLLSHLEHRRDTLHHLSRYNPLPM